MGARGEQIIQVGDQEIRILFTNRALAQAEQAMGKPIIGVAQGLVNGQTGINEVAHLLRAGMQAARRDANERPFTVRLDRAYHVLDEVGFTAVVTIVMEAVTTVLGYGADEDEEESAGNEGSDPNQLSPVG